jgi:hypothetical protein
VSSQIYDDFGKAGYSLADYGKKWMTPNGLGEMAAEDTRSFSGGRLHVSAVPFQTGSDVGVDDHRKYLAISTQTFPVPPDGTLVLSADVKAWTPGTVPGLTQLGVYGPSGSWLDPAEPPTRPQYRAWRLQGQQAGVGIPLDKQGVPFTGIYTSVGHGELVADQLDSVRFGHGLFSLLDAFPFQHPEAPDLSVSIPVGDASGRDAAGRARLFGQGAAGSFGNFTTLTITGPTDRSDIISALVAARS